MTTFIASQVQIIPWKHKQIFVDGKYVEIPFVSVKAKLFEEYLKMTAAPHVCLSIFDGVISRIMSSASIAQCGLDYNYTRLYYCNVQNLVKSLSKMPLPPSFDRSVEAKAKRSISFLDTHRHSEVMIHKYFGAETQIETLRKLTP